MLNAEEIDRIVVVLVRARNPSNIGAVARAMHDFGFRHLRVVNEYAVPFAAARSAVDASAVLGAAKVFDSVAAAVADCTLVMGTTAVGERVLQHPLLALPEAAAAMLGHLAADAQVRHEDGAGRVAILFGSEKTGLSNEELSHCRVLLTIPMQEHEDLRHPSLNLGQAVAVCLYELVRSGGLRLPEGLARGTSAASAAEVERVAVLLSEVLERAGYKRHHPANSEGEDVRRLVVRMGLQATDAPVWMGILRQLLWRLSQ
jgi:TrmH family RNA methyltransferase